MIGEQIQLRSRPVKMKKAFIFFAALCFSLTACYSEPTIADQSSQPVEVESSASVALPPEESMVESFKEAEPTPVSQGLLLPVANVSAPYAKDARYLIDSFYQIDQPIDWQTVEISASVRENGTVLIDWAYPLWGIDFYYLSFNEAIDMARGGASLMEICEEADRIVTSSRGEEVLQYGLLCTDSSGRISTELVCYHNLKEDRFDVSWSSTVEIDLKLRTALYLDDTLIESLLNTDLNLQNVTAQSVSISGYCCGIYFTDGVSEYYLPQDFAEGATTLPLYELCSVSDLMDGLEDYLAYYATHNGNIPSPD